MRITKISVTGLFGMFDHEIPLNQESRITIVHGPNGVGKTVVLQLVHGLFNFEYEYVDAIPFKRLRVFFDNGTTIKVTRFNKVERLLIEYIDDTGSVDSTAFTPQTDIENELHKTLKGHVPSHLHYINWYGLDRWIDSETDDILTKEMLFASYPEAHTAVYGNMPNWLVHIRQQLAISLIQTKRLYSGALDLNTLREVDEANYYRQETQDFIPPEPEGAPVVFSNRLSSLFSTFVLERAHELLNSEDSDQENLRSNLKSFLDESSDKLNRMFALDWANANPATVFGIFGAPKELKDEFFPEERELFEDIINKRILFKSVEIDEKDGFQINSHMGEKIYPSELSSGEMHLLVLYFQLIFESKPDTLVMIDEPELSMNVVWQRNFLKDLQRITELRNFDVLIATHSPEVIYDKWDWTVALGERSHD